MSNNITVFKRLEPSTKVVQPFYANKQFLTTTANSASLGVKMYNGLKPTSFFATDYLSNEPTTTDGIQQCVIFKNIAHLYYNPAEINTFGGNDINKLTRNLKDEVRVIAVPQQLVGDKIKPGSFLLEQSNNTVTVVMSQSLGIPFTASHTNGSHIISVIDDGNGNLIDNGSSNLTRLPATSSLYCTFGPVTASRDTRTGGELFGYFTDTNSSIVLHYGFNEVPCEYKYDGTPPIFNVKNELVDSDSYTTITNDDEVELICHNVTVNDAKFGSGIKFHWLPSNIPSYASTDSFDILKSGLGGVELENEMSDNNKAYTISIWVKREPFIIKSENLNNGEPFIVTATKQSPLSEDLSTILIKNLIPTDSMATKGYETIVAIAGDSSSPKQPFNISVINCNDLSNLSSTTADKIGNIRISANGGGDNIIVETDAFIADNNWHHIVLVRKSSVNEIDLYVDSVLENTISLSEVLITSSFPDNAVIRFGVEYTNTPSETQYQGFIDEFRLYAGGGTTTQLDGTQISDLYNNQPTTQNAIVTETTSLTVDNVVFTNAHAGNIFYNTGHVVFTEEGGRYREMGVGDFTMIHKATQPILERSFVCTLGANEYNFTLNPSARSGSTEESRDFAPFVTGSSFNPYITTIGLYDDFGQLLAIGKLAQPIKKSKQSDMTFVVRIDT